MRNLWEQFANRYMLEFDHVNDEAYNGSSWNDTQ